MALLSRSDGYGRYWYGNEYGITDEQMRDNAGYIWNFLGSNGWSLQAVAGILGNTEYESGMNPAIWQNLDPTDTGNGYGLVQWTPSTKFTDWASERGKDITAMPTACERIIYEKDNNLQWRTSSDFPIGFQRYWNTQNHSAYYCGGAWLLNYERPTAQTVLAYRQEAARKWGYYLATLPKPHGSGNGSKWIYYMRSVNNV